MVKSVAASIISHLSFFLAEPEIVEGFVTRFNSGDLSFMHLLKQSFEKIHYIVFIVQARSLSQPNQVLLFSKLSTLLFCYLPSGFADLICLA